MLDERFNVERKHSTLFNSTIECKGCCRTFKCHKSGKDSYAELDYYIHCVEECEDYKKLELIHECSHCNKIFLNKAGYAQHG